MAVKKTVKRNQQFNAIIKWSVEQHFDGQFTKYWAQIEAIKLTARLRVICHAKHLARPTFFGQQFYDSSMVYLKRHLELYITRISEQMPQNLAAYLNAKSSSAASTKTFPTF